MLRPVSDWRDALLQRFSFPRYERLGRNPLGWPDYVPAEVVRFGIGEIAGTKVVACVWDFAQYGGSFGELDAAAFAEAAARAARYGEPLVSFVRSGGVRLQEGMAALVGMPRAQLALRDLARAGVPHLAVADAPTTGGVFISVVTRADLRVAVNGATVGFAGPRVVEAVTGEPLPAGSHTAESAYEAGHVDAVVAGEQVGDWLGRALAALAADGEPAAAAPPPEVAPPERTGGEQLTAARAPGRADGADVLTGLLTGSVPLRADGGDDTVAAVVGRLPSGARVVGVAVAARRGGRPTPAGYRLLRRATRLAGRLGAPLVALVDTPGAEPGAAAEAGGIGAAIADAMDALLDCPAPTVAVVTGEGGSGGALAAACADLLLVGPDSHFAALGPEGAAAALRCTPAEAADRLGITPRDLLALGVADAVVPDPGAPSFAAAVAAHVAAIAAQDPDVRLAARDRRWAGGATGGLR